MTDPILLLHQADPAAGLEPTAVELARMDAELARLTGSDLAVRAGAASLRRRRSSRLTPRRRLGLGLAVACALAVGVAAAPDRAPRRFAPAPATAATVLTELGRKVAAAPPATGRYAYQETLSYSTHMRPRPGGHGTFAVVVPSEGKRWVSADGDSITTAHEEAPIFPTPQDEADYDASPKLPPLDERPSLSKGLKIGGLTNEQVLALPTDPAALQAAIADNGMAITAAAAQLLGWARTPQPVKAALYQVLRGLPGAKLVGDQKDPRGRTGVGVQFDDDAWTTLFLFDPDSGALIATHAIGKKELPGREISDWTLTLEEGWSDTAPTPTGPTMDWTAR